MVATGSCGNYQIVGPATNISEKKSKQNKTGTHRFDYFKIFTVWWARNLEPGHLTKSFEIQRGVMQGSKLGPILFNILINDLLEKLHDSCLGAALQHITVTALRFADDVMLIAESPSKLQSLIDICGDWAKKMV